jgi:hypothetical protein
VRQIQFPPPAVVQARLLAAARLAKLEPPAIHFTPTAPWLSFWRETAMAAGFPSWISISILLGPE